jgi:hypothetical protein
MTTCQSCGAPITWGITREGKRIPIDEMPSAKGNLLKMECENVRVASVVDPPGERWVSHFATCPQAKTWRRR